MKVTILVILVNILTMSNATPISGSEISTPKPLIESPLSIGFHQQ